MKIVKITDEVYERLAAREGKSFTDRIERLLDEVGQPADINHQMIYEKLIDIELLLEEPTVEITGEKNIALTTSKRPENGKDPRFDTPIADMEKQDGLKKIETKPAGLTKIRTPQIIQAEIDKLLADEAGELEYCQDKDEAQKIHDRYTEQVKPLEEEIVTYWASRKK